MKDLAITIAKNSNLELVNLLYEMYGTLSAKEKRETGYTDFFLFRSPLEVYLQSLLLHAIAADSHINEEELRYLDEVFPATACVTLPSLAKGVFHGVSYSAYCQEVGVQKFADILLPIGEQYEEEVTKLVALLARIDYETEDDYLTPIERDCNDLLKLALLEDNFTNPEEAERAENCIVVFSRLFQKASDEEAKIKDSDPEFTPKWRHVKKASLQEFAKQINVSTPRERNLKKDPEGCEKAVLFLEGFNEREHTGWTGSAFIISEDGLVITCNHCVENATELFVRESYPNKEPEVFRLNVLFRDKDHDFALCQMECGKHDYLELEPHCAKTIKMGRDVILLGFPLGSSLNENPLELNLSFANGAIESRQKLDGEDLVYVTFDGRHGQSGAPVFDKETGKVIGILCGSIGGGASADMQQVTFIRDLSFFFERLNDQEEGA